jgi:hypothetical protein
MSEYLDNTNIIAKPETLIKESKISNNTNINVNPETLIKENKILNNTNIILKPENKLYIPQKNSQIATKQIINKQNNLQPQKTNQLKPNIKKQNVKFNIDEDIDILDPIDPSINQNLLFLNNNDIISKNHINLIGLNIHYESLYLFVIFVMLTIVIWYYSNKAVNDKKNKEKNTEK